MLTHRLEATYDDGHKDTVTADQRDRAGYELQYGKSALRSMAEGNENVWRYLAWHALKRTKRITQAWNAWTETVLVDLLDDEEETDADPGQPTAPATSS